MSHMNKLMENFLKDIQFLPDLNEELENFLKEGLVEVDGAIFLRSLWKFSQTVNSSCFQDKTGFECFVNKIHIDDYVSDQYLLYALRFAKAVFGLQEQLSFRKYLLNIILSIDEYGAVFTFHVVRSGEEYLDENLDEYPQPIMQLNSSETFDIAGISIP